MYAYADFTADYIKKRANWQVRLQKRSAVSVIRPQKAVAFRRFFLPGRQLYTLLYFRIEICLFCTQKQVSTHQFTQFHKVTKISIAISASFVYNVTIRVPAPQMEGFPSRKEY